MGLKKTREDKIYASVLADGMIHVEVPEGTEGAVKRDYETSDGKTGSKFEHTYDELSGKVSSISFYDGDFGKSLQITVEDADGGKPIMLSLNTSSSYAEDVMKKLPNVDINNEVSFIPYSFTDDKGKKKKGMTLKQNGEKIGNYYYDAENKKNLHDFPTPPTPKKGKSLTTDEWKMYFMQTRIFLIEETEKTFASLITETDVEKTDDAEIEYDNF